MTHAEFARQVAQIANGHYCSARVEVTMHSTGTRLEYAAYTGTFGWTGEYATAEEAIAELLGAPPAEPADVDSIGDVAADLSGREVSL